MTTVQYIAIAFCLCAAAVCLYALWQAIRHGHRWDTLPGGRNYHEQFVARKGVHPIASGDSMEDLAQGEAK
jgi:hypothetical protein